MMRRFRAGSDDPTWPWLLAIALGAHLAAPYLYGLFDGARPLTHFRDRAIGQTTLQGIDGSGYAYNYVALMTLLAASIFALFLALSWLDRALRRRIDAAEIDAEYSGLARLGELAIMLAIMRLIIRDEALATLGNLLLGGVSLVFLVVGLKIVLSRRTGLDGVRSLLGDPMCLLALLMMPPSFVVAFQVALEKPIGWASFSAFQGTALYLGILGLLFAVTVWAKTVLAKTKGHAVLAAFPLLWIPISIPLANELQYGWPQLSPRALALTLMALLALTSLLLLAVAPRRLLAISPGKLIAHGYFPLFVVTQVVFKVHRHTLNLGKLDYFHRGEFTVPTQQLFNFSSIPLIDLRPAHTLSDLFYQSLYTLVHGYQGMDMLIWTTWMPVVVTVLLLYFFLARLVSPVFALCVTSLAPVTATVSHYYSLTLVPPLFLAAALRRPTVARFALLWASILALALWRFDFGMVGAIALILVLATDLLSRPARVKPAHIKTMALSLGLVAAASLVVLVGIALVSHRPAVEALVFLVKSYTFRLATRTRAEIIHEYNIVAVLQYYILPCISLIYILHFAVRRLIRGRYLPPRQAMLIFLAIFSLIMSVRSLERHSLVESFNPYLFVFLIATLPFFLAEVEQGREGPGRRALFFGVLMLNALFSLPPSSHAESRLYHIFKTGHIFKPGGLFEPRTWQAGDQRVTYRSERHQNLVRFLTDRLEGDQTFYDFTNSPLLYVLANKKFPTYVIPNIIQTSETIQADVIGDLKSLHGDGLLPFVIFKQGNTFWDNVDKVPNEIRSYRITEFIYQHYVPGVRIGKYDVWFEASHPDPESYVRDYTQRHPLTPSPEPRWHDMTQYRGDDTGHGIATRAGGDDPYVRSLYEMNAFLPLDESRPWALRLKYRSSQAGTLQVFFLADPLGPHERDSVRVNIVETPDGEFKEVVLPILARPGGQPFSDFRFDPPKGSEWTFGDAEIVARDIDWRWLTPTDTAQYHELLQLPYIWGTYDPPEAESQTHPLTELLEGSVSLDPGEEHILRFDPNLDKSSGNYLHLRMRPAQPLLRDLVRDEAKITIEYGEESPSSLTLTPRPAVEESFERHLLERGAEPTMHNAVSVGLGKRTIYKAIGEDPYVYNVFEQAFDLKGPEGIAPNAISFLYLRYRSSRPGSLEIFFGFDSRWFEARDHATVSIAKTSNHGKPRSLIVLIPETGAKWLTDVRFDFPVNGLFEIEHAEVIRGVIKTEDYLVRLSSQWAWMSQSIGEIRVRSNTPMILERASLRQGD